jgi:hypothetical protein
VVASVYHQSVQTRRRRRLQRKVLDRRLPVSHRQRCRLRLIAEGCHHCGVIACRKDFGVLTVGVRGEGPVPRRKDDVRPLDRVSRRGIRHRAGYRALRSLDAQVQNQAGRERRTPTGGVIPVGPGWIAITACGDVAEVARIIARVDVVIDQLRRKP